MKFFKTPVLMMGLIILLVLNSNCTKNQDTVVPNGSPVNGPSNPPPPESMNIMMALCSSMAKCMSVSAATCQTQLSDVNGLGEKLGLSSGLYEPFSAVVGAEESRAIIPNQVAVAHCLADIEKLTCDDLEPAGDISSAIPESPGSCPSVFK